MILNEDPEIRPKTTSFDPAVGHNYCNMYDKYVFMYVCFMYIRP